MGARDRIRTYLLDHVGEVIDTDTLRSVAGINEYARRVRELRDEEGYRILSHRDRSDLRPGQYVLENGTPQPVADRGLSGRLRAQILMRDGSTCQVCGRTVGDVDPTSSGRPLVLHIDHIVPVSEGGTDHPANLRVLCSACNTGRSNLQMPLDQQSLNVLVVVRRAPAAVQRQVYDFLRRKFESDDPDTAPGSDSAEELDQSTF